MAFDVDQGGDIGSRWAPGGKEGEVAVSDVTADQKTPGPKAGAGLIVVRPIEIGQFAIGPVVQPCTFGSLSGGQTPPSRRIKPLRDLQGGSSHRRLPVPGAEMMVGGNAKHIALARAAQRHLDIANAIDAIGGNPGKRHGRHQRTLDHGERKRGLGRKTGAGWHMRRSHPGFIAGPTLGQIKLPVNKGMPQARNIRGKDADLAVRNLPGRARILTGDLAGGLALFEKAGLYKSSSARCSIT